MEFLALEGANDSPKNVFRLLPLEADYPARELAVHVQGLLPCHWVTPAMQRKDVNR